MNDSKTINELMAHHYPRTNYLVERLIPSGAITILSGQSKSYKTYALLDIAIAVASHKQLFQHFDTTQANVLIINEEDGERLLQQRFRQLGIEEKLGLPIHISALTDFKLEDDQVERTIKFCKTNEITLVIIDSLIRVHGADENSAKEMSKVFSQLRKFTKAEIAVLVTQHHRKPSQHSTGGANEMRGSTDILAAVDSHIGVKRDSKDPTLLTFTQGKQRFDIEYDPFRVKAHISELGFSFEFLGNMRKAPEDHEATRFLAVIKMLEVHGELSQTKLLENLQEKQFPINEHKLRELLGAWVDEGKLPPPKKANGKTKIYHLEGIQNGSE